MSLGLPIWKRIRVNKLAPYCWTLPAFLLIFALIAYPFVLALWISLCDKPIAGVGKYVGFRNYIELFSDEVFLRTVRNSLVYTGTAVGLKYLLGLAVALLLNQPLRMRTLLRALILLPWIIPTAANALTWKWMYYESGILNELLAMLGIGEVYWLAKPHLAMISVIIINVWRGTPFFAISFLAGLQSIPRELYEAAEVDGAGSWRKLYHITLPGLRYVTMIVLLLSIVWTFAEFELVYIPTAGGPGAATHIFGTLTYERVFLAGRMGEGVAISVVMFPVLVAAIVLTGRAMSRE